MLKTLIVSYTSETIASRVNKWNDAIFVFRKNYFDFHFYFHVSAKHRWDFLLDEILSVRSRMKN